MVRIVDPAYAARVKAQAETHMAMWRTTDHVDRCQTARYRQVGDAVPPMLAHAVVAELTGGDR